MMSPRRPTFAIMRGDVDGTHFNHFVFESSDGIAFEQKEEEPSFPDVAIRNFYDAHVSIDYQRCPKGYELSFECSYPGL